MKLIGERFGKLVVLEELSERKRGKDVQWLCRCDCGKLHNVTSSNLKQGTKSCGCIVAEVCIKTHTKHAMSTTVEYKTWLGIIERCCNVKSAAYPSYGGRGIKVSPSWRDSFETFFTDMGPRPNGRVFCGRLDNNGDYCKENCFWSTDMSFENFNQRRPKTNTSGKTGVSFNKKSGKWRAYIVKERKQISLGSFDSKQEAIKARESTELLYFGFIKE